MENTPIAKEINQFEQTNGEPIVVTTREAIYIGNTESGFSPCVNVDERVKVEEKYCGPITCCVGVVLFFLFWPATAFMGCCLCDKRTVKKRTVD